VSWTVREADVRSDESDPGRRWGEEQEFLGGIADDRHPALVALRQVGATAPRTRVRRGDRPFEVETEAHFPRVEQLARALLAELNVAGDVALDRSGARTALVIRIDPAALAAGADYDGPLVALVEDLSRYQIVLTQGRFISAEGFSISPDGRLAAPVEPDPSSVGSALRLALTWVEQP
jgi:hypothetical protein